MAINPLSLVLPSKRLSEEAKLCGLGPKVNNILLDQTGREKMVSEGKLSCKCANKDTGP